MNINFNGKMMTGSTEFNLNNMEPTGRISISTPYYIIKSLNMNFEHTGRNWRNFENNGAFEYNGLRYTAGSEFKLTGKMISMKAKVNIPGEYSIKISQGLSADLQSITMDQVAASKLLPMWSLHLLVLREWALRLATASQAQL